MASPKGGKFKSHNTAWGMIRVAPVHKHPTPSSPHPPPKCRLNRQTTPPNGLVNLPPCGETTCSTIFPPLSGHRHGIFPFNSPTFGLPSHTTPGRNLPHGIVDENCTLKRFAHSHLFLTPVFSCVRFPIPFRPQKQSNNQANNLKTQKATKNDAR